MVLIVASNIRTPALASLAAISLLAGCGGGGGGGGGDGGSGQSGSWTPGVYLPSATYKAQCANPRSGSNPVNGQPWPDVQGTTTAENNFLRSYSDETYLWYDEITDRDPALFGTPEYFDLLKTTETTQSGAPKDKFHFTIDTDEWLQQSQSGVSAGYGAEWVIVSASPPREVVVAFTQPGSPATEPGVDLLRGTRILAVDGNDLVNGSGQATVDALNAGLFPAAAGETHSFTVRDPGSSSSRDIEMTSAVVTSVPVQQVQSLPTPTGNVGYLAFHDHIATAESGLIDAIEQLAADGITDLVVDLRYNGGGFLDIASEFAYMIAGDATAGRVFEEIQFNDKHPSTDPVTGRPLAPIPFHSTTQGFDVAAGQPLPSLDLARVFVITGRNTCSASESIINALRGIDVEVLQIGNTTCGKPYGFYPTDNCGTTYFTIQFRGVNDKNFGDYSDGFTPENSAAGGTPVPGCAVADDFDHALGDPLERRLQAALDYRDGQGCPAVAAEQVAARPMTDSLGVPDGGMRRTPSREMKLLSR